MVAKKVVAQESNLIRREGRGGQAQSQTQPMRWGCAPIYPLLLARLEQEYQPLYKVLTTPYRA